MTRAEEEAIKRREKEARDAKQALSKARKDKMLKMEEERKRSAPMTDLEEEAVANKDSLHSRAKQQMDEELDDVKHMNQMMLYSKCVTIRDAQLMEKVRRPQGLFFWPRLCSNSPPPPSSKSWTANAARRRWTWTS